MGISQRALIRVSAAVMVSAVINLPCQLLARLIVPENSTRKYNQPAATELPRPPGQWRYKRGRKKLYCVFFTLCGAVYGQFPFLPFHGHCSHALAWRPA